MNRLVLAIATLAVASCATLSSPDQELRISGFRQGLVGAGASGEPAIVTEGNNFTYAVNGACTAAGKRIPCMWYGFEFSYEGPGEVNVLTCTTNSSMPYTAVDPKKTYGSDVTTFNFSLKLNGRKGYFINPQYLTWPSNTSTAPWHSVTRCEHGSQEVLRFTFTVRAPPNNALQATASLREAAPERGRWASYL